MTNIFRALASIFLLLPSFAIYAQCGTCNQTITAPSSTNITANNNQKICIIGSGTYSGNITSDRSNVTICFGENVTFTGNLTINQSNNEVNNYGLIQNNTNFSINYTFNNYGQISAQSLTVKKEFNNSGHVALTGGLTVDNGGDVDNQATGTIAIRGLTLNSGGDFENSNEAFAAVSIEGNVILNNGADLSSDGVIYTNGNFTLNSGAEIELEGGGLDITGALILNEGTKLEGEAGGDCSGIKYGTILINNNPTVKNVDLCQRDDPNATISTTRGGFTNVTSCSCSQFLPVSWVSFEAITQGGGVALTWETASEVNNSHFEVERSADGHVFSKIGEVAGKGNFIGQSAYRFRDEQPLVGANYYRLRQVDFDGKAHYSKVVRANGRLNGSDWSVQLSEDGEGLQIFFDERLERVTIEIFDSMGNQLASDFSQSDLREMEVKLPVRVGGMYVVKVVNPTFTATKKILIR